MVTTRLRGAVLGVALLTGAGTAQAAPTTALYLLMDGSGSISSGDFATQVSGYTAALSSFFTANPSAFGQVAIGGAIFGRDYSQFFALQEITDSTVLSALNSAITGLNVPPDSRGGIDTSATKIYDSIVTATAALAVYKTAEPTVTKMVIDVTTDGADNASSTSLATAMTGAISAGVNAVNCLGLGGAADCSFVSGYGTNFGIVNFADLSASLAAKITTETVGVPEPMTLALFGLGLAGIGLVRRRAA